MHGRNASGRMWVGRKAHLNALICMISSTMSGRARVVAPSSREA
jgi:hypothetical protein